MDDFEASYIKCKKLALELLEIEVQMIKLEIEQVEIRKALTTAIDEVEKATKENLDNID